MPMDVTRLKTKMIGLDLNTSDHLIDHEGPSQDTEEQRRYADQLCGHGFSEEAMEAGLIKEQDLFTLFALVNNAHPWTGHVWPPAQACLRRWGHQWPVQTSYIAETLEGGRSGQTVQRQANSKYELARQPRVIGIGPDDAQRRLWEKWQADKI